MELALCFRIVGIQTYHRFIAHILNFVNQKSKCKIFLFRQIIWDIGSTKSQIFRRPTTQSPKNSKTKERGKVVKINSLNLGQGFPAHKVAAIAAYRDRCQTKKETHMQGHVQRT